MKMSKKAFDEMNKEGDRTMNRTDSCPTCKHELLSSTKEPCKTCLGYVQVRPCWEPKEKEQ